MILMFLASNAAFKIIYYYLPLGIFTLGFLLALGIHIWKPNHLSKVLKWGIGAFVVIHIVRAAYLVWLQYKTWQGDKFGRYFLPPHQPITYFWHYVWMHFLDILPWTFGGAAVLGIVVLAIGIISKGRMVDAVDAQLAVFGALIIGWPDMLGFFIVTLAVTLFGGVVYGIINRQKSVVIPITWFFFAGILIAFFWGSEITNFLQLKQLVV